LRPTFATLMQTRPPGTSTRYVSFQTRIRKARYSSSVRLLSYSCRRYTAASHHQVHGARQLLHLLAGERRSHPLGIGFSIACCPLTRRACPIQARYRTRSNHVPTPGEPKDEVAVVLRLGILWVPCRMKLAPNIYISNKCGQRRNAPACRLHYASIKLSVPKVFLQDCVRILKPSGRCIRMKGYAS
jgi:hypothetical protein